VRSSTISWNEIQEGSFASNYIPDVTTAGFPAFAYLKPIISKETSKLPSGATNPLYSATSNQMAHWMMMSGKNGVDECRVGVYALRTTRSWPYAVGRGWTWMEITDLLSGDGPPALVDAKIHITEGQRGRQWMVVMGGRRCDTGEQNNRIYALSIGTF
jgi:hypothetical protein